jgi:glutamate--cysteine ligase
MKHVSERFGIAWLGLGIHPLAKLDDLPRMPRERYGLMRSFLSERGNLALWMMHGTGTVQANFDFSSEADAARKLRLALAASPIITALYANSGVSEGGPNGFESRRAWVWRHTDPARCGFPAFVFSDEWLEGGAYRHYAEWALDVPCLFIVRGEHHVPLGGRTFRDYLQNGHAGERATLADWNVHLTTLFPEARMKRVIEVRGADAVPPSLVCALPAFWKGLFYDDTSLDAALERVRPWSAAEVDALHAQVARKGLSATSPGGPVLDIARELVDLSAAGLARIGAENPRGETEELFLEPLYEILDRGVSPARAVLDLWDGAWAGRIDRLIEYAKY